MSTSGTVSATVFETRAVIDRAFGRCRLKPQQITDEMILIAKDNLYLGLSDLVNTGAPLWTRYQQLMTMTQGLSTITLPTGTVDVSSAFLGTLLNPSPTSGPTYSGSAVSWGFGTGNPTAVSRIQLTWSAAPVAFNVQTSPDNATWTTVTPNVTTYSSAAGAYWYNLDGANPAAFWQIVPATGTLSVTNIILGNVSSDITMARISEDTYAAMPNKFFQGRPLQFFLDRQLTPVAHLWPVPDAMNANFPAVFWLRRHIMDVGSLPQQLEVPQRWIDAIIWKLASYLAYEIPEVDPEWVPVVEKKADAELREAWTEERDKSPVAFQANLSAYTR